MSPDTIQKADARDMLDRLYHDGKYANVIGQAGDPIMALSIMNKFKCDSLEELRIWAFAPVPHVVRRS